MCMAIRFALLQSTSSLNYAQKFFSLIGRSAEVYVRLSCASGPRGRDHMQSAGVGPVSTGYILRGLHWYSLGLDYINHGK